MTITQNTQFVHSQSVLASNVDNEIVMASINTDKFYGLDAVSTQIWKLLEQPNTLDNVCSTLVGLYDVDREQCESEVLSFVQKLVDAQLLEVV